MYQTFVWHLDRFSCCGKYNSRYYCTKGITFSLSRPDIFHPCTRHSRKTVVHTNTHRKKNPNRHFLGGKDCKHTPHLKPEKQTCARTFPDTERAIQTYTNKHSLPERTKHINTHTHTLWDYAKSERGTQTLQKFKKHARRRKKAKNTKLHTLRETNTHTSRA